MLFLLFYQYIENKVDLDGVCTLDFQVNLLGTPPGSLFFVFPLALEDSAQQASKDFNF